MSDKPKILKDAMDRIATQPELVNQLKEYYRQKKRGKKN